MSEKETEKVYMSCKSCFKYWTQEVPISESHNETREGLCDYCMDKTFSSLELLKRRLDVLDQAVIYKFPEFIRHLVKHLDLREEK